VDQLTPAGLQVVNALALRHGFSQEAVLQMMVAMVRGRGAMAQFNHPEFAGSGQWMAGGMLMLGDMFNHALKARVDGLCQAIAAELTSQGGAGAGLFIPDPRDTWWPPELGTPSAIGTQNEVRYAFFPAAARLAIDANGQVSVYDTGGHQIAGVAQQQGPGGTVVFATPGGSVSLTSLSAISGGLQSQSQSSSAGGLHQQAQSSSGGSHQQQQVSPGLPTPAAMAPLSGLAPMAGMGPMTGMAPMAGLASLPSMAPMQAWWPPELGTPSATGAQNSLRYALFPTAQRLAVERDGRVTVHNSGELQLSGCSQSGTSGEVRFTTSDGATIALSSLPEVPPTAPATPTGAATPPAAPAAPVETATTAPTAPATSPNAVLEALTKLGELKDLGVLTAEEFAAKKAELLKRL